MIERLGSLVDHLRHGPLGDLQSGLHAALGPELLDCAGSALIGLIVFACFFMMPRA